MKHELANSWVQYNIYVYIVYIYIVYIYIFSHESLVTCPISSMKARPPSPFRHLNVVGSHERLGAWDPEKAGSHVTLGIPGGFPMVDIEKAMDNCHLQ